MTTDPRWSLGTRKRWQITAELMTRSSLHIGSSESIHHPENNNDGEPVDINSVIRGRNNLPILPGSSLKGKLRQWLAEREVDPALLESVFGKEHDGQEKDEKKKQGSGGRAEFHDAHICTPLKGEQPHYPYWREDYQTWIMASTAIDRHTGSALHQHLRSTEVVPPGVVFKVVISGVMDDNKENPEVDILLAALQGCRDSKTGIFLGAGEADGMGRMQLCQKVEARFMDSSSICAWLNSIEDGSSGAMAMDDATCFRLLAEKEIQDRAASVLEKNPDSSDQEDLRLEVTLPFDGPFLVSHPVNKEKIDPKQPDLIPLRDNDGKPLLPASSLRGALRSQAERIVRTLGGRCCSPADPCQPLGDIKELETLCPVCQVFGAAGWKTGIRIHDFRCIQVNKEKNRQDFVAIDRFHGGGKDGAKFAVEHSECPCFQGQITISSRVKEAGRGLLALVLRDLREGDITFGSGANKGYGNLRTEAVRVENLERLIPYITAFREYVATDPGKYLCANVPEPEQHNELLLPAEPTTQQAAQNQFHNPYHFVPVKPPKTDSWLPRESLGKDELKETSPYHSHALYRQETEDEAGEKMPLYHGRIICRLETETPLFIGAEGGKREENDSAEPNDVPNYYLNGALAIPATSLRGMISGLAEAASNSAMRVLENGVLSFRKIAENALRDIGMVVSEGDRISVLPLSSSAQAYKLKHAYSNHAMMKFLDDKHSWSPQHNTVYYASSPGTVPDTTYANGKTPGILRILGKDANRIEELQNKLHELFIKIPQQYVDTETNRFDYQQYLSDQKDRLLPVPEQVRERYQELADERSKSQKSDQELKKDQDGTSTRWLPFHLKGAERERDATDRFCTLPLKHGDLVWYSMEGNNVAELSFSSIWRSRVEDERQLASKVGSFFPDQELLPFNPKRKRISPAELLFGFVEDLGKEKENPGKETEKKQALTFTGKVRCSSGVLPADAPKDSDLLESKRITLKALSTPKPPSPALYFTRKEGADDSKAISKEELSADSHRAMGRKHYLHALRRKDDPVAVQQLDKQGHPADSGIHSYPWKSLHPKDRPEMKVRVQPIVTGTSFYFHLDFSNLTEWELGLLCFALRPNEAFRHKLGMGKPIGLGTVRIDLAGLHCIDRKERYAEDEPEVARYNQGGWTDPNLRNELAKAGYDLPERGTAPDPETCRQHFLKTIDPDIYRALDLLGNPQHVHHPVHYPQVTMDKTGTQADIEEENFKWFVENDKEHHEYLQPLGKEGAPLPLLTRRQEVERGD
ncbi:MAG: TIGR03986 family CRISPR-associated RAMP protein [Candidatus Electrothrix sp. Rat3]|nr:TIGR03986 family CRISPR-associated RAMP protein [Candidatus Electrothrix rattekaaiensis]